MPKHILHLSLQFYVLLFFLLIILCLVVLEPLFKPIYFNFWYNKPNVSFISLCLFLFTINYRKCHALEAIFCCSLVKIRSNNEPFNYSNVISAKGIFLLLSGSRCYCYWQPLLVFSYHAGSGHCICRSPNCCGRCHLAE